MTPDWSQAPPGATHYNIHNGRRYHPLPTRPPCRLDDTTMDAYSTKLTVIAALLLTLMYLFYDLMLHPLPA